FSANDATFSLQVRLPCEQTLTFISKVNQHPSITSLTLSSFQQSHQDPRYTEKRFSGKWQSGKYQISQHGHSEQDCENNKKKTK
ncbi:PilN domain-containing protein, partial [Proteus mirabilis]